MPRVTYSTAVSADIGGEPAESFGPTVDRVLADPRGWAKYGFAFERAAAGARPDVAIRLVPAAAAADGCGVPGFSCWREERGDILINLANWTGGSRSRLPLERYRNYVLMHETGHALGLEHQRCPAAECARRGLKECPAPVMAQMTRGPRHVWPCVESDWPLDPDWGVEDPRRVPRPRGHALPAGLLYAAAAIVVVLVVCLAVILAGLAGLSPGSRWGAAPDAQPAQSGARPGARAST